MLTFPSFFNAKAGAYEIEQSLRFNGSDSAYLINSTPSTDGNRKTYTISVWVKKVVNSGTGGDTFFYATADASNIYAFTSLSFGNADAGHLESLRFLASDSGASQYKVRESSDAAYRDYSAWMHVVAVMDTTQATAADRAKIYVNGEQITDLASSYAEPAQNYQNYVNGNNARVQIGRNFNEVGQGPWYFDGYLAEYHLVDGTALDPTSFGEFDNNGVWRPKRYTGSHGTNGFYLTFDPSATNGIGHDHSGNGNHFTANNFTTSGTGTDVMSDTPTTNWATLNALSTSANGTFSDGNLSFTGASGWGGSKSSIAIPATGKWYAEFTLVSTSSNSAQADMGIFPEGNSNGYNWTGSYGLEANNGFFLITNGSYSSNRGGTTAGGSIFQIAVDADNGKVWFGVDNSWYDTYNTTNGDPSAGTNPSGSSIDFFATTFFMGVKSELNTWVANFGQRAFAYTPPTGFKALNTANLPAPTVKDGSKNFNTVLWSGNGVSGRAITGVGFQPDFLWIRGRNIAVSAYLQNSIAGATYYMFSDDTIYERNIDDSVDSFDTDGFTLGNDSGTNGSGGTYVGWNWLAGGSVSADNNTDGSITSTVSANPTAGFSIVTYTGTGANATVGHGLGVPPKMVIIKRRDVSSNWAVYHDGFGPTKVALLDDPIYAVSQGSTYWQSTAPSDTVVTLGTTSVVNYLNGTYVAYCFAEVEGYSKFGSYEGNDADPGPFVYLGFKPALILLKNADASQDWVIYDTKRSAYNEAYQHLHPNTSGAENTTSNDNSLDILSNGFRPMGNTSSNDATNGPSQTIIYAAFAEHPFGGSGVSPATAR